MKWSISMFKNVLLMSHDEPMKIGAFYYFFNVFCITHSNKNNLILAEMFNNVSWIWLFIENIMTIIYEKMFQGTVPLPLRKFRSQNSCIFGGKSLHLHETFTSSTESNPLHWICAKTGSCLSNIEMMNHFPCHTKSYPFLAIQSERTKKGEIYMIF